MLEDFRRAWRTILRMPALAAVVVVSLAAGIGVNTVVFSWIQARLLRPLPGVAGGAAFQLIEPRTREGMYPGMSWPEYRDLRDQLQSVRDFLAFRPLPVYLGASGSVERVYGMLVSENYFPALGLRPAVGRFFRPEEGVRGNDAAVAVISYGLWQARFSGSSDAVGQPLRVNGETLTVVGVAPPPFQGTVLGLNFDVWLPAALAPLVVNGSRELDDRAVRGYSAMARVNPGATRPQAQSELDAAMGELARSHPATNATIHAQVLPMRDAPRGPQRLLTMALALLQGMMLLLLLAVCGNTANLVLARASARQREIAVRLALGARPWRIVRLLLTENVLLGLCGAVAAIPIAVWGTRALQLLPLSGLPIRFQTSIDGAGLAFAVFLGVACGAMFGAAPASQLARLDPHAVFRSGSRSAARSRLRNALMGIQVALAMLVLIVAGLFLRSFLDTRDTDPGFRREGVLLAAYDLAASRPTARQPVLFADQLLRHVRAHPAVADAAIASAVPLDIHGLAARSFTVEGHARTDAGSDRALTMTVTPGYFAVMDVPLRAGSDFAALTDTTAPAQAVVNEEFVRRYLPRLEPLGRRLVSRGRTYVICGVVRTSLYNAFGEAPAAIIYLSYRDNPAPAGEIHVRTKDGDEHALAADVRRVVRDIDPDVPVFNVRSLTDHVETNLVFRRVPARMFAVLGPLLLVLASIGIYAVVAYTVSLRTTEIGVRLAVGATPRQVIARVMGESLQVVAVGALAGWSIALVVAMDVSGGRIDAGVFAGVPLLLAVVATVACWVPAWHGARLDPAVALRQE